MNILEGEIKGITLKIIWTVGVAYSSILISVLGIYFSSKNNFERLREQMKVESISREHNMEWINQQTKQLRLKQEIMQNDLNLQRIEIERIKTHLQIN